MLCGGIPWGEYKNGRPQRLKEGQLSKNKEKKIMNPWHIKADIKTLLSIFSRASLSTSNSVLKIMSLTRQILY